jgi:Domain of unknown function (DUF4349)
MMHRSFVTVPVSLVFLLAACAKSPDGGTNTALREMAVSGSPVAADAASRGEAMADPTAAPSIPQSEPQIAYSYTYGYRIAAGAIDAVQAKHVALCDKLGKTRCRIGNMRRSSSDGEFTEAALTLFVDAKIARVFGNELDKAVAAEGGENSDRGIQAEDLSKQIIDTDARIKAKQALADRLLALIQNKSGSVADLVAAERAFADAQEELDAARSSIADLRGRVALSQIEISYASRNPSGSGFMRPVREAFASAGQGLGSSLGALVTFIVVAFPWVLLLSALLWLKRRMGWKLGLRRPWGRRDPA